MASRTIYRYESRKDPQDLLRSRIKDIAQARFRYGYRRIHILLRREGWEMNCKRVYRLYKEENLSLRTKKPRRHVSCNRRGGLTPSSKANECWSMDFVSDALFDGKRIRALPIIALYTRECLYIGVDFSIKGGQVVSALEHISLMRGKPKMIRCDNGPEFISKVLDKWCYEQGVYQKLGK